MPRRGLCYTVFPWNIFPGCLQQHKLEYEPVFMDKMCLIFHPLEAVFVLVNQTKYSLKLERFLVCDVFSEPK